MLDAHNHLDFEVFDEDRERVLEDALATGLRGLIIAGYDRERRALAVHLVRTPGVFACAGLHPWAVRDMHEDGEQLDAALDALRQDLQAHRGSFCGLGECGLDYHVAKTEAARAFQEHAFLQQLEIAADFGLPVVIHAVKCHDRLLHLLSKHPHEPGGQLHGYSGPAGMVERFIELGWAISFGTPLTWEGYQKTKKALQRAWSCDRAMVTLETDAPDRPAAPHARDTRGEPAHLARVLAVASELLEEDEVEVARVCEANARRIFDLPEEEILSLV